MFEDYVEKGADFPEFVIKGNCSKGNYFLNPKDYSNRYFKVNIFCNIKAIYIQEKN